MFLGLRTVIYRVEDLEEGKAWYGSALGIEPYFDEPFYVGFDVGGYELGLLPAGEEGPPGKGGVDAYWGVEEIGPAFERLLELGARELGAPENVGEGIHVARVLDPWGNMVGIIENPHFQPGKAG